MPDYTSAAEVFTTLQNLSVGVPSRLTASDVEDIIDELEAQVNGAIKAQGYTVPATDSSDVKMLGGMVRKKAAVQVYLSLNQPQRSPDWCRSWDIDFSEWLGKLSGGKIALVGETPVSARENEIVGFKFRVLPYLSDPEDV